MWSPWRTWLALIRARILLNAESLAPFKLAFPLAHIVSRLRVFVLPSRIAMHTARPPVAAALSS
jgi:hypothetical protein